MAEVVSIFVGLTTALIGYVIGRIWHRVADWLPYRRARLFLGPAVKGGVQIVASRFSVTEFREPTGVVGGGDALALRELATFFAKIGLRQADTLFVDEGRLNARGNLILLGGLDTNKVTMAAMKLLKANVTIFDPGPGIPMEIHDLGPEAELQSNAEKPLTRREYKAVPGEIDYGIVIRAPNPFDTSKAIVIIAGAYGYGSWGGVDLIQQDEFLRKCEELDLRGRERAAGVSGMGAALRCLKVAVSGSGSSQGWSGLECIFRVGVFDDRPTAPEIVEFRALPRSSTSAGASSFPPTKSDPPSADAARPWS
jgi:hypothetical protein